MSFGRAAALFIVCAGLALRPAPATAAPDDDVLYILPLWEFPASETELTTEVARLRSQIGEGRYARVGFTVYITISMTDWSVDPSDRTAVRAALSATISRINAAVNRARAHQIPICLSFLTALRSEYDPVQMVSEQEDRRNMQWYGDNALAAGWWTHSRYARKIRTVQEAYIREIGSVVADLMHDYPETLVAATGDGEIELSFDRSPPFDPSLTAETSSFADYSPFAVAEFRDWLTAAGMYASGQPFEGQAYVNASRYVGDLTPDRDTNADGNTLNRDFGLTLQSWSLRYGDWSLADSVLAGAIPFAVYSQPGWMMPDAGTLFFDAPRTRAPGTPWWSVWMQFREMMVWRHNLDFARWMTTTPGNSGTTVPSTRWYSDQIPADYLFGHTPANPDLRLETSASPWWTADVAPYGSIGITSFNANQGNGNFARTLALVAPQIAASNHRWGITEWNPSVPASASIDVYRQDLDIVRQYKPSLLVPLRWGHSLYRVDTAPFITALREFADQVKRGVPAVPSVPPFGTVDTPIHGTTGITGSIGVTGWALDDVGVSGVKIYRNCLSGIDNPASCQTIGTRQVVFIGDAAFLPGARPDVEAQFSDQPYAYRAGWGYLMLTNMLPHVPGRNPSGGGQGTLTILAFATDLENNRALLGETTITLDNDHATRPFGAIDTPTQGASVFGTFPNFGWALTPGTATIPRDGSTMRVVLDGSSIGTVNYDQCRLGPTNKPPEGTCRDDIATLFPNFTNIMNGSGAIGSFDIDTTTLTNGLHTIAWGVVDDQSRNDGIGSRFFNVVNGSGLVADLRTASVAPEPHVLARVDAIADRYVADSGVWGRTGFHFDAGLEPITADTSGTRYVRIVELDRLELRFNDPVIGGYLRANETLRPLPPGSQLNTETRTFTWAPGAGYIGSYELVFLHGNAQIAVQVMIEPKRIEVPGRLRAHIDLPAPNASVSGSFVIAGWALDLDAWQGSGVGAVHVWAHRRDVPVSEPIFVGSADVGGSRPDVANAFGPQFDRAGWGLTASSLERGLYDITAYFWSNRTQQFEDARTTTVSLR